MAAAKRDLRWLAATAPASVGSGRRRGHGDYPPPAPHRVARRRSSGAVRRRDHSHSIHRKTFTARATTRATVINAMHDWTHMMPFAPRDRGMTSVGLKAVAFVKDTYR